MSKKNKKTSNVSSNQQRQQQVQAQMEAPYIVDMDTLAYATDDDIRERLTYLNSTKNQAIRSGIDPYLWEVELAYVQRECGIREARSIAHEKFIRLNPDQEIFEAYENNIDIEQTDLN